MGVVRKWIEKSRPNWNANIIISKIEDKNQTQNEC